MQTKLVARILDGGNTLLAWAELTGIARGDGALWPDPPSLTLIAEAAGTPAALSIHWCDINVETRVPFVGDAVTPGQAIPVTFDGPVLRVGPAAGGLSPVTVGASRVVVPVGVLGAKT